MGLPFMREPAVEVEEQGPPQPLPLLVQLVEQVACQEGEAVVVEPATEMGLATPPALAVPAAEAW